MSKNTKRRAVSFNIGLLKESHKKILSIYLPFISQDFHYLFHDLGLYDEPSYIHAFIFSVWQTAQMNIHPPSIRISEQLASMPFHSLLFHISHPTY
jgi:hypothetical protein